jgi:alpha-glucosidase
MLLLALACSNPRTGDFELELERDLGRFTVRHDTRGLVLEDAQVSAGLGMTRADEVDFAFGSFRFPDDDAGMIEGARIARVDEVLGGLALGIEDGDKQPLGELFARAVGDALLLQWIPLDDDLDRAQLSAACPARDEAFQGLGSHAFDVDHRGEAFPVWVSEPGIGKVDSDEAPADWFITGTRHASSFPMPWVLLPETHLGILADTSARVEVDLCAQDERFHLRSWEGATTWALITGDTALDPIRGLAQANGLRELSAPWVFAPWNDAVRGEDRVLGVLQSIVDSGAASSVIWTEDWKGAEEIATGYHLTGEWFLDRELYPEAEAMAATLQAQGIQWFAYFSPFLTADTVTWDEAAEEGVILQTEDGRDYTFDGPTFEEMSMVDLTLPAGRAFALERMEAALDLGFSGWMADYAEWLPVDAVVHQGDPWLAHNAWPLLWQELNDAAIADRDASFFVRSGWNGTSAQAPVVWLGDQETSFQPEDGFPTVVPLALGLSAGGVPVIGHDIGGYMSLGVDNTDQELWFRWAALGAFSPIMRTHHGADAEDNHSFDRDPETLEYWAGLTWEHMRLFPYRYGLAARASRDGTPMLLHPAWLFEGEDAARKDVWMLGPSLLVAPVMERGVRELRVELPEEVDWYDYWTGQRARSGVFEAPLDHIPVFVASGSVIPTFEEIPLTGLSGAERPGIEDVDGSRRITVYGPGGSFEEADGTLYEATGEGSGTETAELTSGTLNGLEISGSVRRAYTVVRID